LDGHLIAHRYGTSRCEGSWTEPADDIALASWLPLIPGLTPHGLRHGHQTWMDEIGVPDALKSERMGHELPGMRGIYSHVSPAMRADLAAALQERWCDSLAARAQLAPHSFVGLLSTLLAVG
jgi:integrase